MRYAEQWLTRFAATGGLYVFTLEFYANCAESIVSTTTANDCTAV